MSTFKYKNSLRTTEAEISLKLKNIEARPKFTGSYKKACVCRVINWTFTFYSCENRFFKDSFHAELTHFSWKH